MSTLARLARVARRLLTNTNGFAIDATFTTPDGTKTIVVGALCVGHSLSFDNQGKAFNSETDRITVSEKALNDLNYPTRNDQQKITLVGHRVSYTDVQGMLFTYTIRQSIPDKTLGTITLMLDYKK